MLIPSSYYASCYLYNLCKRCLQHLQTIVSCIAAGDFSPLWIEADHCQSTSVACEIQRQASSPSSPSTRVSPTQWSITTKHHEQSIPASITTKHHHQASPPSITTKHHHQTSPPSITTKHHHQPSPPSIANKQYQQASPPCITTKHHHQASPPNVTINHHHQASPPNVTTNHHHQASPTSNTSKHRLHASPILPPHLTLPSKPPIQHIHRRHDSRHHNATTVTRTFVPSSTAA